MAEFQSLVAATLPPGSRVKTDTIGGELVEHVYDSGWLNQSGRSIVINYTDATKTVISSVEFQESAVTVFTLTPTFAATSDTWTRS